MLQDVPDYAQRRRLLEGLKNRLEALLSPKIVAAFNNHSLGKPPAFKYSCDFFIHFVIQMYLVCLDFHDTCVPGTKE